MSDAVNDSSNANACVRDVVTSLEYWIAAIAATDIGKVYAHHRTENLQEKKSQQYTSTLFKNPDCQPHQTLNPCTLTNFGRNLQTLSTTLPSQN